MATAGGPDIERDGLVFGYDTGYGVFDNSGTYRFNFGEPATNSQDYDKTVMTQTGFDAWGCYDGNNSSPSYHYWGNAQSKTLVNIKGPDNKYVNAMLYHNFTGGFHGPTHWSGVASSLLTIGSKITVQGWVKAADTASVGKTVTPYLYYSKVGGAYSSGTNYTLTAEWQLVSHSYTVPEGSTGNGIMYFFTSGGTDIKMYLTKTGIVGNKTHAVQWLPGGTTRSSSGSLIDLTRTTTIDVSNVSFDSTGQPTFDGTDDYIEVADNNSLDLTTNMTFEFVVKANSSQSNSYPRLIDKSNYLIHITQTSPFTIAFNVTISGGTLRQTAIGSAFTANNYSHIVCTYDGQFGKIYTNGSLVKTSDFSSVAGASTNSTSLKFGGNGTSDRVLNGEIPIAKVYSRALSADEVQQNYNAYKNRFNL
jgi:hypothetical protein